MKSSTLGILGGLGPASGVYFARMLVEHTRAERDQEHIDFLLSSRATTPDRTDFILGRCEDDPVPVMAEEVARLIRAGADLIAIPCNTAHHFYDRIAERSSIPVLNIIDQTVAYCRHLGAKKIGVLATEGTISSGAYEKVCRASGIAYTTCTEEEQAFVSRLIYEQIKAGQSPDTEGLYAIVLRLLSDGCDAVILGCTELSLLKSALPKNPALIDSLEVLALSAIRLCGKTPKDFDPPLLNFYP